ncbi:hypothetical protein [Salicola sp. Rm-C-2C1-2]|uniref:hypothetical protein n=1 Tax=Salicola sp. Rm-C-2C1-2 TaxID=3141321 RepID=UPI0032E3E88C
MTGELGAEDIPLTRSQASGKIWPFEAVEGMWQHRVLPMLIERDAALFERVMTVVRYTYPPPSWAALEHSGAIYAADHPEAMPLELEALESTWLAQGLPGENKNIRVSFAGYYTFQCLYQKSSDSHCWRIARGLLAQLIDAHCGADSEQITVPQTYTHVLKLRKALLEFVPRIAQQGTVCDETSLADAVVQRLEEAMEQLASDDNERTPTRQVIEILTGNRTLGGANPRRKTYSSGTDADQPALPRELIQTAPRETNPQTRERHQARPETVVTRTESGQFWPKAQTVGTGTGASELEEPAPSVATQKLVHQLARWEGQDESPVADDPEQIDRVIAELPVEQRQPARTRARKRRPLQRLRGSADVHRVKSGVVRALLQSADSPEELVFMTLVHLGRSPKQVEKLAIVEQLDAQSNVATLRYERARHWLWMPIDGGPDSHCRVLVSGLLRQALARCSSSDQPLAGLTRIIDQRGRSRAFRRLGGLPITAERLRAAGWLALRPIAGDDMITEALGGRLRAASATDIAYRRIANQSLQDAFDGFVHQLGLAPRQEPGLFELYDEHGTDNIGSQSGFGLDDAFELIDQLRLSTESLKHGDRSARANDENRRIINFINRTTSLLYLLLALCTASRPWGAETENSLHCDGRYHFILHSEKNTKTHTERRWLPVPPWLARWLHCWRGWVEDWKRRQTRTGWQWQGGGALRTVLPERIHMTASRQQLKGNAFTHADFKRELDALMPQSSSWRAYRDKSRGNALRHLVATRAQTKLGRSAQHWLLGHIRESDANLHWSSSRSVWTDERDIRRFQQNLVSTVCPLELALPAAEDMQLREVDRG